MSRPEPMDTDDINAMAAHYLLEMLNTAIPPGCTLYRAEGVPPGRERNNAEANVLMIVMTHCALGMARIDGRAETIKRLEAMLRGVRNQPLPGVPP